MPYVSGPVEGGHLKKDKAEKMWARTVGGSVYAEEDRFACFRYAVRRLFKDEEPDGDESETSSDPGGGGRGVR